MAKAFTVTTPIALVVVPTYNEAQNIGRLLGTITLQQHSVTDYRLAILVMDDKSPDGTAAIVKTAQKNLPNITLLTGSKQGLGTAYIRAFKYALHRLNPTIIIMMDADFSHDPATIPSMIAAIDAGADYVIGSRNTQGGMIPGNWPMRRIANSRVANWLARRILGIADDITDLTGGFKAIRAATLRTIDLDALHASGYVFQVSLLYAFIQQEATIREVPIKFADREFGVSKLSIKDIMEFMYRVFSMNPNSALRVAIRYGIVGIIGTIVNVSVLYGLTQYSAWAPTRAIIVAIEISIICNFILNRQYTFAHISKPGDLRQTFLRYQIGAAGVALFAYMLFISFFRGFSMPYILADILAISISFAVGLLYSSRLVWSRQNA